MNAPSSTIPQRSWLVWALAGLQFLHLVDFVLLMPLGPILIREFQLTNFQFGLLVSSYTWSAGILGLLSSLVLDQIDRRRSLLISIFGFSLGTLWCGFAGSYEELFLSRALAGGFAGVMTSLIMAVVADVVTEKQRGKAYGTVLSAFSVASTIGVPLCLYLATRLHWRVPLILLGALGFLTFLGFWKLFPSLRAHLSSNKISLSAGIQEVRELVSSKRLLPSYGLVIFFRFSGFLIIPYISVFLVGNLQVAVEHLFLIYLIGGAFTFFMSHLAGMLADRYGSKRILYLFGGLSILPILAVTQLKTLSMPIILLVTTSFMILLASRWIPAMNLISTTPPPEKRGAFMALLTAIQHLGIGLASVVAGKLITSGALVADRIENFGSVGVLSALSTLLAILMIQFLKPESKANSDLSLDHSPVVPAPEAHFGVLDKRED